MSTEGRSPTMLHVWWCIRAHASCMHAGMLYLCGISRTSGQGIRIRISAWKRKRYDTLISVCMISVDHMPSFCGWGHFWITISVGGVTASGGEKTHEIFVQKSSTAAYFAKLTSELSRDRPSRYEHWSSSLVWFTCMTMYLNCYHIIL